MTEAYVPFWTQRMGTGVWDFIGKVGNSQVDEKEETFGKHSCQASQEQWDIEEGLMNRCF